MTLRISERDFGAGALCRSILDQLPEWFGIPESNADYARLADEGPAWLAVDDGEVVGLMLLKPHFETAVEIYLLAVVPARHRSGVGRALSAAAEAWAKARGARYLTVKTRGPSLPYEPYERTRAFYLATGFVPLEEFTEIWGPENPALLMVKAVAT
jgi:GNAT superfamily N-acetyltransferase